MAQIGTIRLETPSGPVDVPVFELGDVSNNYLRVETASGAGAINVVDPANAELNQVRIQTNNGVRAISTSTTAPSGVTLVWETVADFESTVSESGVTSESTPNTDYTDPSVMKHGYSLDEDITRGLEGWWPLHDDSASDLSGSGNDGTLNGGVTTGVAGRSGLQAVSLDGTDDEIDFGQNVNTLSADDPFMFCFWYRWPNDPNSDSNTYVRTFAGDADSGTNYQGIRVDDEATTAGEMRFAIRDSSGNEISRNSDGINFDADNEWHHYAFTYDGSGVDSGLRFYKDAQPISSNTESANDISGSDISPSTGWLLGSRSDGNYCEGVFYGHRFYSRSVSDSEIQQLYRWGEADIATPNNNGVAYYRLDGDATDSFGTNDGTVNGATFVNDAIRGQAASFDGTDDYIDLGTGALDAISTTDRFTASFWFNPETIGTSNSRIITSQGNNDAGFYFKDHDANSGDYQYAVVDSDGNLISADPSEQPFSEGDWYHITLLYDGSEIQLYLNANLIDTTSYSGDVGGGNSLELGGSQSGEPFDGKIDDVRIYDFALTQPEIQQLYRYGTRGIDMSEKVVKY